VVSWIRHPRSHELNRMTWPRTTRRTVARLVPIQLLHLGEAQLRRETHRAVVGGLGAQHREYAGRKHINTSNTFTFGANISLNKIVAAQQATGRDGKLSGGAA